VLKSLRVPTGSSIVVFGALRSGSGCNHGRSGSRGRFDHRNRLVPERLDRASDLGATHAFDGKDQNLARLLRQTVRGELDFALDTTAVPQAITTAVGALSTVGVCGLLAASETETLISTAAFANGRSVRGIIQGDAVPQLMIPELIGMWQKGNFPFTDLIDTFPLESINEVEQSVREGKTIKPVLVP
jgi:aryl-alcohol dehydrogenase